ncbi:TerC family protein [Bacillus sp. 1P06AnD]|uniref:TerC family protein n=1 Tax=Bacillus sp. 1P06AnD TaxID=3132208 RepID=UPI0039A343F7
MLHDILASYASLLDLHMWIEELSKPSSWGLVASLAVLEILLSADNALVLSAFVQRLPKHQQKKALVYGLWGAYIFRFILIGLGTYLIHLWFIKLLGALYLLWLSINFFREKFSSSSEKEEDGAPEQKEIKGVLVRTFGLFWATIISIELMDLSFSVDSILASLAVSDEVWLVLLGGMIGILVMRGIATVFITLMEKVPELETTAYLLIAFIAVKMGITLIDIEIPNSIFFTVMIVAFVATFIVHYVKENRKTKSV